MYARRWGPAVFETSFSEGLMRLSISRSLPVMLATCAIATHAGAEKPLQAPPKGFPATVEEAVAAMQAVYDATTDLTAEFTQVYQSQFSAKAVTQAGQVAFRKPGMMRWNYTSPAARAFVADGETLWVYDAAEKQVTIVEHFKTAQAPEAVSFLWGQGDIAAQFNVALAPGESLVNAKVAGVLKLALTPKAPTPAVKELRAEVNTGSWRITRAVLTDTAGNRNELKFSAFKANQKLPAAQFQFVPPPGTEILRTASPAETGP